MHARLLDAAANRAREAVRVLEDASRFLLDNAELTRALKVLRHDLAATLGQLECDEMHRQAARDTPEDVGTSIRTAREYERTTHRDVVIAAGKRLSEALRSLEEFSKIDAPEVAPEFEAMRYRAYELERRLTLACGTGRAEAWPLCVLITEALCEHHPWQEVTERAIEGGATCLQLREKDLEDRALRERAAELVACAAGRAAVFINDRPDIALLAGADGVHVGQTDLSVRDVRRIAGGRLMVGVTAATMDAARQAHEDGADVIGLGPMFPSRTKPKPSLAGPSLIAAYEASPLPMPPYLAISGITPENVHELAAVGCRSVAVSGVVCGAEDPAAVCRALIEGLKAPQPA